MKTKLETIKFSNQYHVTTGKALIVNHLTTEIIITDKIMRMELHGCINYQLLQQKINY